MSNFKIRTAQREDVPALADLLREIGYFTLINNETVDITQARIAHHLELCLADNSHSIYVAVFEDEPTDLLGYLSVHWLPYLFHKGPEGYISELFIRQAARGQGIGSALLDTAVGEARQRGCGRMMLINM